MSKPIWIKLEPSRAAELHGTEAVVLHEGVKRIGQLRVTNGEGSLSCVKLSLSGCEHNRAWFLDLDLDADQVARLEPLQTLNDDEPNWVLR